MNLHLVIALIALGCTVLGLVAGLWFKWRQDSRQFVSCDTCAQRHKAEDERHQKLDARLKDGERKFNRLGGQVAALVVYNPHIPEDKKAGLLDPAGGKE